MSEGKVWIKNMEKVYSILSVQKMSKSTKREMAELIRVAYFNGANAAKESPDSIPQDKRCVEAMCNSVKVNQ